jgi:hypothetical protein
MQELQKTETARVAVEAWTSDAKEAATPKAPTGGTKAQKPGEATSAPAVPEV